MARHTPLGALLLLCFVGALAASPTDQVSREHWSYDLLASLAAQGLVPGKSSRDFSLLYQYSKAEMAQMVADCLDYVTAHPDISPTVRSSLRKLAVHYQRVHPLAGRTLPDPGPAGPGLITPSAEVDLQVFSDSQEADGTRGSLRLSVLDDLTLPDSFFDVQVTAGNDPLDLTFGNKNRPRFSRACMRIHHSWYDFELGRQQIRWGPGYLSSTSISDLSRPPFIARFSTDIRIGKLRMPYEQFAGFFSDMGKLKYLVGRRLEIPLGSRASWTVGEFAKSRRLPHPATFVLPLSAAQEWFIKKEAGVPQYENELNIALTTTLSYRCSRRLDVYGEWTLDDVRVSLFGFGGASVPYKAAYLVGFHSPDLFGTGRTAGRAEYMFTNEQTYIHRLPEMGLFNEGVPIGASIGSDSDTLFVRLDHRLSRRDSAVLQFRRTHHGRHTPAVQTDTSVGLSYTRDVTPSTFATATVQYFKSDNVNNVAGNDFDGSRVVITASGRY